MAPTKRSRSASKKKAGKSKSYTVLKKATIDPNRKLSTQGKPAVTTKTGAYLAARLALRKRTRPTRIYLYRKKKIMTFSITYTKKSGKIKAKAKLSGTKSVTRKKKPKKKSTKKKKKKVKRKTKKRKLSKSAEIAKLEKKLVRLSQGLRRRSV